MRRKDLVRLASLTSCFGEGTNKSRLAFESRAGAAVYGCGSQVNPKEKRWLKTRGPRRERWGWGYIGRGVLLDSFLYPSPIFAREGRLPGACASCSCGFLSVAKFILASPQTLFANNTPFRSCLSLLQVRHRSESQTVEEQHGGHLQNVLPKY